jgi:V/A-type H+-transporting ATPase subunit F
MMEIALIGDRHTVYGFRLAGLRKTFRIEGTGKEDIRGVLKDLFGGNIALILVTERVAEEIGGMLEEAARFKKGIMPIVIEIPDSGGTSLDRIDPIRELIRKTVGFEIA